jgi:hypothetical protein
MGRIRTIKPEFFRSRSMAKISLPARMTFQGLWCEADDHGRGIADTRILKGVIWPLDDEMTPAVLDDHLSELVITGHVVLYEVDGDRFYEVVNWAKHQAAAYRRGVAVHPSPDQGQTLHVEECKNVQDARPVVLEGKGREGNCELGREAPLAEPVAETQPVVLLPAEALKSRLSQPTTFVEIVDPGGPVALRKEAAAVIAEAERLAGPDRKLLDSERPKMLALARDAVNQGYDPAEVAEAIASSPFRTAPAVMGELRKRKQPSTFREPRSVGDRGLDPAAEWLATKEAR